MEEVLYAEMEQLLNDVGYFLERISAGMVEQREFGLMTTRISDLLEKVRKPRGDC